MELWQFSLAFYERPGVAAACLACQDQVGPDSGAGADVNLILFLLWQGQAQAGFTTADIAVIDAAITDWRTSVVQPLRAVRRALKDQGKLALREQVKAAELAAEHMQQTVLSRYARSPGGHSMARANLDAYAGLLPNGLPAQVVSVLLQALDGHD